VSFFDPISFLIGAGVGTAAGAGGLYLLKDRLPGVNRGEPESKQEAVEQAVTPRTSGRYSGDALNFFQRRHIAGQKFPLLNVLVEPRFLRARPPRLVIEQDDEGILVETDIYRVIPMLHQFPAAYASFNLETIRLKDLETGAQHIAILGIPGSGKTTALMALGLIALGALDPEKVFRMEDTARFDTVEEDERVPQEVRERRRKEREEVQRRAIEQLRIRQRREEEQEQIDLRDQDVNFEELTPIYIHLQDLDLEPGTYGGKIDPAEPIVAAQRRYISSNTAVMSTPMLYRALSQNRALVLIDGYDDLASNERERYFDWLSAFLEHYGGNFIVMTGPPAGYDMLMNIGFAPAFIRPLNETHFDELTRKWTDAWTGTQPDEKDLQRLLIDRRNRTVMDVTLKIWATMEGDIQETGRRGYYENYVRHQLGNVGSGFEILQEAAAAWLNQGAAPDREMMRHIVRRCLGLEAAPEGEDASDTQKRKKGGGSNDGRTLNQLLQTPLLLEKPDGTFAFCHPMVAWYLAGESLSHAKPDKLAALGDNPDWWGALSFATAIVDLEPAIVKRVLQNKPDLMYDTMFHVVEWMPDAPSGLRWTGEVLKRLGSVLMAPNQFPTIREHAMAALIAARDESGGVTVLLRQAVRSGNPDLRRLGCIGLGAIGSPEAIKDLAQMLFDDSQEVQLAAGLGLGAIGTEEALAGMIEALLEGEENLRKAVAEAMAAIPGEGHAILFDGVTHESMYVRRASVFGLARIPATWALVALYRAMLEDSQWYVRSAAEMAFSHAREPRSSGPQLYPEPDRYEWLAQWTAQRGEAVPEGPSGRQLLMRALQEAPTRIKVEAARSLGKLAHTPAIKALYASLAAPEPEVRVAAFDALGQMAERIGRPMPGVA
jgi:HEAT repeat protein